MPKCIYNEQRSHQQEWTRSNYQVALEHDNDQVVNRPLRAIFGWDLTSLGRRRKALFQEEEELGPARSGSSSSSPSPQPIISEYIQKRPISLEPYKSQEFVQTRPSCPSPHYVKPKKSKESEGYVYNGEVLPHASIVPFFQIDQGAFSQEKKLIYHAPFVTITNKKSVKYKEQ